MTEATNVIDLEQHLDGARWEKIITPAEGVPLKPSGVIIARTEAERFEREHGIFGQHAAENDQQPAKACEGPIGQSGAPAPCNWNAFAGAVARRVHDEGMPASQGTVLSIPGVGDVLKPTIDTLRTKLAEISGQPGTLGAGR